MHAVPCKPDIEIQGCRGSRMACCNLYAKTNLYAPKELGWLVVPDFRKYSNVVQLPNKSKCTLLPTGLIVLLWRLGPVLHYH